MFALLLSAALAGLPLARAEWQWTPGSTAWVVVVSIIGSIILLTIIGTCIRSAYIANKMAEQMAQYRPPPPLQQSVYSVSVLELANGGLRRKEMGDTGRERAG